MSVMMDEEIKRWTARRKSALVLEIIQGKTTVAQAAREFDLTPSEIEEWIEHGKAGLENALRAKPEDVREQYERQLSRSGKASTAAAALEQALIARFGSLGRVDATFLLRSDNGLVFTSRAYTRLVRSYGLRQEFITPHCPQQNGMVERVIRTLKEQCAHRHRFESQQHASRVIGDWIGFYNHRRPHQALGMRTPAQAYALAA